MSYGPATIRRRQSPEERARRRRSVSFHMLLIVPALVLGGVSLGGRPAARPSISPERALAAVSSQMLELSLPFPADQARTLIQGYESEFTHTLSDRYALDFGMSAGEPVFSAGAGRVIQVVKGWGRTYPRGPAVLGNLVKIDHGDGFVTVYAHLRDVFVREGRQLERGALIGTAGTSGYSTRPHLHFRLTRWGAPMRPEPMSGYADFATGGRYVSDNVPVNTRAGYDETSPNGRMTDPGPGAAIRSPGRTTVAGRFFDNVEVARVTFYWRYADEGNERDRMIGRSSAPTDDGVFELDWRHRIKPGRAVIVRAVPEDAAGNRDDGIKVVLSVVSAVAQQLARVSEGGGPTGL